ncbi:MAG: insulinase family protein [Pyrinomonadaceae bacterium]|nr:insulinase family protein [Pyrinomonadaceae bacterium]
MKTSLSDSLFSLILPLLIVLSQPSSLTAQSTTGGQPSAAQRATPFAAVPKVEFEKYTLPNGLQVILHVDRKLPVVHVNQWFHVGSKNEQAGRTGFAHLFEHMMFQGSKNATGEYVSYVEKAGANLFTGGVNGTTDNDRTNYFATVPSANLEYLLWLEADRLATLPDALTKEKLDNQRDVVKNERRQGLENQPYGRAFTLLVENLHPKGHPYSWSVIGSHEDLTAASLEDVRGFFKTYYTPNNLSLVITGDFDRAEAKRLIEKYFAGIPAGPALDRPARWVPQLDGEKIVEVSDRVPQERVYLAWPSPPTFEAGDAELQIASAILTDGLSSRLQKVLVYDRQLASNVFSFQNSNEISGLFGVVATARPGAQLAQIEQLITDEVARLTTSGPTAEELNRVRTKIEYGFISGLERIGGFGGKADRLAKYNTFLGDPGKFEEDLARYRKATTTSVRDAVGKWLNTRNRLLVRFHPETSGRESQVTLDRSPPPSIGADKAFTAPEVKTAKLENGLHVFVVERKELPKVAVMLTTRAGAVSDPAGKEGVAHLTVTTIDLGTRTKNALEIENALGDLGTSLSGSAGRETSNLSFQVLKPNLAPAFSIFADVVRNSVFPESEVAREKKIHLDNLAQQANDQNALAARIGDMLLFGPSHPYGRPRTGLPGTVAPVTRTDLARFTKLIGNPEARP